jgi:2-polyprenyl-3-methyl-5-hydroxy-6-metoxy-1,4-benzoquinol methylase
MMIMNPRRERSPVPSRSAGEPRHARPTCVICGHGGQNVMGETCDVTSNVRAFATERFRLWRCAGCQSIHARDEVDLAHYYSRYPFFDLPMDWRLRCAYKEQLRRLEAAGVQHHHRILDYGCGSGAFLRYLAECGYADAAGFDGYNPEFSQEDVLNAEYDCVLSQDVLEHVDEPQALLDRFHRLTKPGGLIALGTPNASAIDLSRAEDYRHALHAPYHRHIFSKPALLAVGAPRGWSCVHYYATQYANTPVPFLNSPFYLFFMRTQDDTLDCLLEQPPRVAPVLAQLPAALFWGLCGSYRAEETDVMVIFRRT